MDADGGQAKGPTPLKGGRYATTTFYGPRMAPKWETPT